MPRVVDISADYRYPSAAAYGAVSTLTRMAPPQRLGQFTCALPEHLTAAHRPRHIAHPGCFATAVLLASVPLLVAAPNDPHSIRGWSDRQHRLPAASRSRAPITRCAIADLYSYSALGHRHVPEIAACARAATGIEAEIAFVPHSGTVRARYSCDGARPTYLEPQDSAAVRAALRTFYAAAPFVRVLDTPPRLKDVVASNYAHLSASADGRTVAVMCAIDNPRQGCPPGAPCNG